MNIEPRAHKEDDRRTRVDPELLFDTLRNRICLLDYPPGTRLREADLAREFGVSRTPIRSVFQRLAQDGLIEPRDGVGTIVTAPNFSDIHDIYLMRLKVAELIGEMNPRCIEIGHIQTMDTLIYRTEAIVRGFDIQEYWRINHDKHFLIAGLIGNKALREAWDRLYFQAARMWYSLARRVTHGIADDLMAELTETRRALARNDAMAVSLVQRNHIGYGLKRLEAEYAAQAITCVENV